MSEENPTQETEKRTQISTTVSAEELEILQEIRWQNRHDKLSHLLKAALDEYIATHG